MKKYFYIFCVVLLIGCNSPVGNAGAIISIQSNLKSKALRSISDSLHNKGTLKLPKEYEYLIDDLNDHEFLNLRYHYLENEPKELYITRFHFSKDIVYIYSFDKKEFINNRSKLSKKEYLRVKNRFLKDILKTLELEALQEGVDPKDLYVTPDGPSL